jgi:hypothetical protein
MSELTLRLSHEDVGLYTNVLNEILNGFKVRDFEEQIGMSREAAESLLQRLDEAYKASTETGKQYLALGIDEVRALKAGFLLCIRELGEEEMSARTGFSVPEAERHLLVLDNLLHGIPMA